MISVEVYHLAVSPALIDRVNSEGWDAGREWMDLTIPMSTKAGEEKRAALAAKLFKSPTEDLQYRKVATIDAEALGTNSLFALDVAYDKTNSIDAHWSAGTDFAGMVVHEPNARSTSVGDIMIINHANLPPEAHIVVSFGFNPVTLEQA